MLAILPRSALLFRSSLPQFQPSADPPARRLHDSPSRKIRFDETQDVAEIFEVKPSSARDMRDITTPGFPFGRSIRVIKPKLDDERMRVEFSQLVTRLIHKILPRERLSRLVNKIQLRCSP